MNNLTFKVANISDAFIIDEIESDYEIDRYSLDTIKLSLLDENYINIIALADNLPVGYVSATKILDEGNIIKIITRLNFRRMGIANMLMNELFSKFKENGVRKVFLEVRCDNNPAKSLYEKYGFKKEGERKGYYNGVDAHIYWMYLND